MWQASSFPDTLIYLSIKCKKKFWRQLPGKRLQDLILGDLPTVIRLLCRKRRRGGFRLPARMGNSFLWQGQLRIWAATAPGRM